MFGLLIINHKTIELKNKNHKQLLYTEDHLFFMFF